MAISSDQKLRRSTFELTIQNEKLTPEPNVIYEMLNEQHTVFLNMSVEHNELVEETVDNYEEVCGQDVSTCADAANMQSNMKTGGCEVISEVCVQLQLGTEVNNTSCCKTHFEKTCKREEISNNLYCPDCRKSFETKSGLKKHRLNIHNYDGGAKRDPSHKTNGLIRHCPQCLKLFETMSGLRKHLKNVHKTITIPTIKCRFCSEKLFLSSDLEKHILKCHHELGKDKLNTKAGYESYADSDKSAEFKTQKITAFSLNEKCRSIIPNDEGLLKARIFSANISRDLFTSVWIQQDSEKDSKEITHIPTIEKSYKAKDTSNRSQPSQEQNALQCPDCIKSYETVSGLRKHRQNIHNYGGGPTKKPKDKNICTIRQCHQCSKLFETMSGLRKHLINAHRTNSLPTIACTFCSEKFYLNTDLEKHVLKSHQNVDRFIDARWHCGECGKGFRTRTTLHDHRLYTGHKAPRRPYIRNAKRENGTEGTFQCDICKRFYTTKRKVRHHMEMHYGERKKQKFLCTVCGIWLSSNHILQSHYRAIHLGEKPHKCMYCDRLFSSRQELKQHTNRHEGIRPYSCAQCPRTFFVRTNLREHIESIHLNAKRHVCAVCNKSFNRKGNLKLHTYTHTQQSPHQCPFCGAGFMRKYKLNEHVEYCKS